MVAAAILGHKADIGLMVLAPTCGELRAFQTGRRRGRAPGRRLLRLATEISEYAAGMPEELNRPGSSRQLPPEGKPAFCFYPMSKRRGAEHNWYALEFEERKALMLGHGAVGRTFRGPGPPADHRLDRP